MSHNSNPQYENNQKSVGDMDIDSQRRDKFELLSAYLDGEVTAAERKQVQQWLDTDPQMQQLERRLLKLRHGIQNMPIPNPVSAEVVQAKVVAAQAQRKLRRSLVWGGGAIAAVLVGAVSILNPGEGLKPQFAQNTTEAEPLMIAINQPAVEIPKAAVSSPER